MQSKRIKYNVDIASIIELMGKSLYSRVETPIRELIQNGHDAVMRRRQREIDYRGEIRIRQNPERGSIVFSDDGVGLTPQEAEKYLSTLGLGMTRLLKGQGANVLDGRSDGPGADLIGQFGVGLFSAFMLADQVIVSSKADRAETGVRWVGTANSDIEITEIPLDNIGTSVELILKPEFAELTRDTEMLEESVKMFADFISVPIYLNDASARINMINAVWFEETPDTDHLEMELASYFDEQPLDVIPIRCEHPVSIAGAIYVSPQRTPGFSDDAVVAVTIRRMIISRKIQDLLPPWGSFFRGVLELHDCKPTASREDIVRDKAFEAVRVVLEDRLFEHFEQQLQENPKRLEALVDVHRYSLAGSALSTPRLRNLLQHCYRWSTSRGRLTFEEIVSACQAAMPFDGDDRIVIWYNPDRRQERWMNELFQDSNAVCVHAIRSFEESLLAAMVADTADPEVDLQAASVRSDGFATTILGMSELERADDSWQRFLDATEATIYVAGFQSGQPAVAFLNERFELQQTIDELKNEGDIPHGFQRLIERHFEQNPTGKNEVILNRNHRLVRSALRRSIEHPLASVLRLLVVNSLLSAGARIGSELQSQQREDLTWISEALDRPAS